MLRKTGRQEGKGTTEDEMVGWHHWLSGHEFEQTLGDDEGQGSLVCCSPWGCKESDMTEELNNNTLIPNKYNNSKKTINYRPCRLVNMDTNLPLKC